MAEKNSALVNLSFGKKNEILIILPIKKVRFKTFLFTMPVNDNYIIFSGYFSLLIPRNGVFVVLIRFANFFAKNEKKIFLF